MTAKSPSRAASRHLPRLPSRQPEASIPCRIQPGTIPSPIFGHAACGVRPSTRMDTVCNETPFPMFFGASLAGSSVPRSGGHQPYEDWYYELLCQSIHLVLCLFFDDKPGFP